MLLKILAFSTLLSIAFAQGGYNSTGGFFYNVTSFPYYNSSGFFNDSVPINVSYFTDCGGDLVGDGGNIQSPLYPNSYPHNARCEWTITTEPGTRVKVTFDRFSLEGGHSCPYDSLVINDGSSNSSNRLLEACGGRIPGEVVSSSNVMSIRFTSDPSVNDPGFNVYWSEVDANYTTASPPYTTTTSTPVPTTTLSSSDCGGTLNGTIGLILSPNYPGSYYSSSHCVWTITTEPGLKVRLSFTNFDLEAASSCGYDSLRVYDGSSSASRRLGNLCGEGTPAPITSSGNEMYLVFVADASVVRSGFRAFWSGVNGTSSGWTDSDMNSTSSWWVNAYNTTSGYGHSNSSYTTTGPNATAPSWYETTTFYNRSGFADCGGDLSGDQGIVQSPNHPGMYPDMANCVWTITTDPGTRVRLTVDDMIIEYYNGCPYDSLTVRDGNNSFSPQLKKLCGRVQPPPLESSSNVMYLKFKSDSSITYSGFSAQWTTVWDGTTDSPIYPIVNLTNVWNNPGRGNGRGNGRGIGLGRAP